MSGRYSRRLRPTAGDASAGTGRKKLDRKKSAQRQPICSICERKVPKTTEEHAYPAWLLRHTRTSFRSPPPHFVPAPGWEQDSKVVLKRVCEQCQHELNVKFETPARGLILSILDGAAVDLSERERAALAGWFCKTAIVLALARSQRPADNRLNPQELGRLRTTLRQMLPDGKPPLGASVRIAQRSLIAMPSQGGLVSPPRLDEPFLLISTYSFENVMCEVVIEADPATIGRLAAIRDPRFIVLWPPGAETIHWPPPSSVAYPDVSVLGREWGLDRAGESSMLPLFPTRNEDEDKS